jgi:hypothetical protein
MAHAGGTVAKGSARPAGRSAARPDAARPAAAAVPVLSLRRCACGGSCPRCRGDALRPKLAINTPGDAFEREADAAAEAVMSGAPAASPSPAPPLLRRCACGGSCPSCKQEKEEELQREDAGGGGAPGFAPPVVHDVLASPGRPLPRSTRGFMETRFGADFSGVRVHDDARAADSARAVDAHAYAVGSDLVFGAGRYAPGTAAGDRLLAHELAHTLQQGGFARRLQRACGVAAIGAPAGCTPQAAEWLSGYSSYRFDQNCDNLATGERTRMITDAPALPATIEVHGYASTDGDPTFNQNLSCARAKKARDLLVAPSPGGAALPAARIAGVFSHGATAGTAADRMSVVLAPPAPTPTPLPATVPTPGAGDFVIERVRTSRSSRIYFARGSHTLTTSAATAIAALRGSSPGPVRLVGYVSGDEPAALAQQRADEVRAALTAAPGALTVPSAVGNPAAMARASDYSEVRAVEVLTGSAAPQRDCAATDAQGHLLNPPVLACPTLDPDTWTAFNAAWPIAKDAMTQALAAVGATPNLPLVDRFFGNHDPSTLTALQTNLANLDAHVRRLDTITSCGDHCDTGKCAEGWIAYNSNVDAASSMTLCVPGFKELSHVNDQARNLIHESAHGTTPLGGPAAAGEGTKDVAYRHERILFQLSTADRLRNSDSYALFALFARQEHLTGIPGATPAGIAVPANDNLVGFSAPEEPVMRLALAKLEKRLTWATDKMAQTYGRADRVKAGTSTWTPGDAQTDRMTQAAARFPLTAPTATPTATDMDRLAAILERYRRMKSAVKRDLTATRVPTGVVSWTSGGTAWVAGSTLEAGPEFFRATPEDQVSILLENLARATRDVEAAYVPAYVSLAAWIHAQNP